MNTSTILITGAAGNLGGLLANSMQPNYSMPKKPNKSHTIFTINSRILKHYE